MMAECQVTASTTAPLVQSWLMIIFARCNIVTVLGGNEMVITTGDISTALLTSSAALLGLSALILITIRLSNYSDIKERVSRRDYNRLYDWTLGSFISGTLSVIIMLFYFVFFKPCLLFTSGVMMAVQTGTLAFGFLRTLWPFKFCYKHQREIWRKTRAHEKELKKREKKAKPD